MNLSASPRSTAPTNPFRELSFAVKRQVKNVLFRWPSMRSGFVLARQRLDTAVYRSQQTLRGMVMSSAQARAKTFEHLPFPVVRTIHGQYSFITKATPGKPKAFVATIPKSGTFLLDAILSHVGLAYDGIHIGETGIYDYRSDEKKEVIANIRLKIDCPLIVSTQLVQPGQFAAGHLIYDPEVRKLMEDMRMFFAYREIRAAMVSRMRWLRRDGHGDEFGTAWKQEPDDKRRMEIWMRLYAASTVHTYRAISGWRKDSLPLQVKFETLYGDEGEAAQLDLIRKIAAHVDVSISEEDARQLIATVLGAKTRTWSGGRSSLEQYWTPECETIFKACGGEDLNRFLGYAS